MNPTPITVTLSYPRTEGKQHLVRIDLEDVRAADQLEIEFDFERNGWVIRMDETREDGGCMAVVREKVEIAFVPAWNEVTE